MNLEQASALNYRPPCVSCQARAYDECANCGTSLCDDCKVVCAGCPDHNDAPWCAKCAISRGAFEQRGDAWFCENCPLPDAREVL